MIKIRLSYAVGSHVISVGNAAKISNGKSVMCRLRQNL